MNPYALLGAAIVSELFGTTCLEDLPIGVVVFQEQVDLPGAVGVSLILAGVYLLNVVSEMSAH
jgi:multidrug transporter EmrE-like cation transporter